MVYCKSFLFILLGTLCEYFSQLHILCLELYQGHMQIALIKYTNLPVLYSPQYDILCPGIGGQRSAWGIDRDTVYIVNLVVNAMSFSTLLKKRNGITTFFTNSPI